MVQPLVSLIITTKNEEVVLENLLISIKDQTYKKIQILVVDNNSTDKTVEIAKKYTSYVFNFGPERSAQRNFGAKKARGKYLLFLDADMVLESSVVKQCMEKSSQSNSKALIVPEKSYGKNFWAKVKKFERDFYIGDTSIEAARFYEKKLFIFLGGFDEDITGPEDWDLSNQASKHTKVERIKAFILHNEGSLSIIKLMKKKYYYARKTKQYLSKNKIKTFSPKTVFFLRSSYYKQPKKILYHPILFTSMVAMLSLELMAGGYGFFIKKNEKK